MTIADKVIKYFKDEITDVDEELYYSLIAFISNGHMLRLPVPVAKKAIDVVFRYVTNDASLRVMDGHCNRDGGFEEGDVDELETFHQKKLATFAALLATSTDKHPLNVWVVRGAK